MRARSAGILLLLVFIFGSVIAEDEVIYKNFNLKIGQLFSIPAESKKDDIRFETFPSWITYNGSYIFGVPQADLVLREISQVQFHLGKNVWANVNLDFKDENPCGYISTLFFEVYRDKSYNDYSVKQLNDEIQDFATTMDVDVSEFRVFRYDYLNTWRTEENQVFSNIESNIKNDQLVIVWKLGCGSIDDNEDYVNIVSVVSDNGFNYRVVQAIVNNVDAREFTQVSEEWTTMDTSVRRTTRHSDSPPARMKSLQTYNCVKGKICLLRIPNGLFMDDLDSTLKYSVHPINNKYNFFEAEEGSDVMKGIALKEGKFEFRLEARDRSNQVASAPFIVDVKGEPKADYNLEFTIDRLFSNFNGIARCEFMEKLATALKTKSENVRMDAVSEGSGQRQTSVKVHVSDHYEDGECDQEKIKQTFKQISSSKGNPRIPFVRQMGPIYHVRKVNLKLFGRCGELTDEDLSESTESQTDKTDTTKMTNVHAEVDSVVHRMLLPLIVIAILAVLLVLLVIYCCMFRKPGSKKQKKPLEYVTKGHPVVFPNELNHEDDTPSVAAPMLIKDERPPLQPQLDGTTVHENPLYKAPSVGRTSVSTDNANLNTVGVSRPIGTPNQRLPPPYVAP